MSTGVADLVSRAVASIAQIPKELFINGEWVEGSGAPIANRNPATGEIFAHVANATADDAMRALDAAAAAQSSWRNLAPRKRGNLLHAAHRLMLERAELFAQAMTLESGKPLSESRAEFSLSADFFLWFAEQTAHVHGTYAHGSHGGYRVLVTHQPIGPTLLITPWNFPLLMIVRKGGAALAAGCTTVVKSAQETPLTGALFVKTLQDAGFPPGVVNLVHTTDSAGVADRLLADFRLRKISFTGSTRVGALLLARGAENVVSSSLELGGDGPFLVLDDADVEKAVDHAIICKFRNAGQACVAANRIIVHRSIEAAFTQRFLEKTRALRVGNGLADVDVGPMISEKQRARLAETIADLVAAGGEVLTGGHVVDGAGYFYEPTVIRFSSPNPIMCSNELFAPIATIFAVDTIEEALRFANDSSFGLASYLFTKDLSRAFSIGEQLEFGMVGINRGIMADPGAPFGGTKASGLGREAGQHGIYEFMEPKYLAVTVDEVGGRVAD